MRTMILIASLLVAAGVAARADDEASNRPVVRSSEYGLYYARSIPGEDYGQSGETLIYSVEREGDVLLCSYDWFSGEIYMGGSGDMTVVRFGPWQRGWAPEDGHLAIGIYRDGEVVREYSTLDISLLGSGVSQSVSHYEVFGERLGFRWIDGNRYVFEVEGVNGMVFSFDLDTGDIVE